MFPCYFDCCRVFSPEYCWIVSLQLVQRLGVVALSIKRLILSQRFVSAAAAHDTLTMCIDCVLWTDLHAPDVGYPSVSPACLYVFLIALNRSQPDGVRRINRVDVIAWHIPTLQFSLEEANLTFDVPTPGIPPNWLCLIAPVQLEKTLSASGLCIRAADIRVCVYWITMNIKH